jgi:hypothetical protein
MTRRVASAALSAVLLVLAVVTGLSVSGAPTSASVATAAAAHTSPVTQGADRRPGAALAHLTVERHPAGWSPLDPPLADLAETAWTTGEFASPDLIHVAGLSIVTAGPVRHPGRAPPGVSALS